MKSPYHDHATPSDRLDPRPIRRPHDPARYTTAAGWQYYPAIRTDIRRAFRRWYAESGVPMPAWLAESAGDSGPSVQEQHDLPSILRRQA